MRLRLFRNATQRLHYAGHELLLDPFFAPKHSRPSYAGRSPNPLVDLPCPPEEIMAGAELLIVSQLHSDHFDPEAQRLLPKDLPIFCQPGLPSSTGSFQRVNGSFRPEDAHCDFASRSCPSWSEVC
jgi:L-ascorbate metabolism protein UlaG (beta-lactamase superfamily)